MEILLKGTLAVLSLPIKHNQHTVPAHGYRNVAFPYLNLARLYLSMFCCTLLYVHSSIAIILMGKRELVVLLLSFWYLVIVERLFAAVQGVGCGW